MREINDIDTFETKLKQIFGQDTTLFETEKNKYKKIFEEGKKVIIQPPDKEELQKLYKGTTIKYYSLIDKDGMIKGK